jgi:hypothetical protein
MEDSHEGSHCQDQPDSDMLNNSRTKIYQGLLGFWESGLQMHDAGRCGGEKKQIELRSAPLGTSRLQQDGDQLRRHPRVWAKLFTKIKI